LRVVYVSTLPRGGPVSHLYDLVPAVAELGIDARVVCGDHSVASEFQRLGVQTTVAPIESKLDVLGSGRLWSALKGADVVHTHDRRAGLFGRTYGRALGARVVHTLHGIPEEVFVQVGRDGAPKPPGVSELRLRWLLHGVIRIEASLSYLGAVIVPSRALADFAIRHGFPAKRLHLIPYGVRVLRTEPPPERDTVRIGTAAVLEYRKGIDVLLEACARANEAFELHVYGDGPERSALERQSRALGVEVRFHGFLDDFRERIAELDVFVLPTRGDNLPVAILEAMANALPVVATSVGGVPELVVDGETGLLVSPDDPDGLAVALDRVAADRDLRVAFGQAAARRVLRHFETSEIARRVNALYEDLCAK
jgi:glycosyltransferase involved in cell wall biosynthesis